MCLLVQDEKTGEMNSEYPFLFCSKSDFWMEIADDKVNHFEKKTNAQNDVCLEQSNSYSSVLFIRLSHMLLNRF